MTAVTRADLGAWLVRCNPAKWDLVGFRAAGGHRIDSVSVVDNYRSAMMAPGDPVVLWVSGNGRLLARGIWGIGHVTAGVRDEPAAAVPDRPHHWRDERTRLRVRNAVFVDIPLFDSPIPDGELRAASLGDLEVQRQPMGSNPSWLSKAQLARLEPLLPVPARHPPGCGAGSMAP